MPEPRDASAPGLGRGAVAALVRDPNYRFLWIGQFISIFGDRFTYLALLGVVMSRAHDPANPAAELAVLPLASFLPTILFGPWIGAMVDRFDTLRVLILSDAARGVAVLAMIPATLAGGLPALFLLVFALYVANTFFLPARSAVMPLLVPEERLTEANSLATFAGVAATIVGSVVAGLLIDRYGWAWAFVLDAATYFASVYFLSRIRAARPARATDANAAGGTPPGGAAERYARLAAEIREGVSILGRTPRAWWVTAAVTLLWMAGGVLHVTAPILVGAADGATGAAPGAKVASGVGILLASAAAGMVAGTLGLAARGRAGSPRLRLALGLLGTGGSLVLFAAFHRAPASLAVGFVAGLFVSLLLVTTETVLQEAIAPEARGRVFALRDTAARLAVLATAGTAGWVVSRGFAPRDAVTAAGALLAVAGLAGFFGGAAGSRRSSSLRPGDR